MEVIVITSPGKNDHEIAQIAELFENGLETLHVRKPKFTSQEIEHYLLSIPKRYYDRLVLHGHYKLAIKHRLKGVHLHRRHRKPKLRNRWKLFWMRLRNPRLKIATTFHSLQSLRENTWSFDYVFLSPIFTSHAHYSDEESSGINLLKSVIIESRSKVFALGGVTLEKLPIVQAAGFHGVGISGAVWKASTDHIKSLALFKAA